MKLLIVIIVLFSLFYMISKYLFPFLLNRFIRKTQEKFQQYQQDSTPVDHKTEGEVNVDYVPPESKKSEFNPDSAEDVDFEEVKEN